MAITAYRGSLKRLVWLAAGLVMFAALSSSFGLLSGRTKSNGKWQVSSNSSAGSRRSSGRENESDDGDQRKRSIIRIKSPVKAAKEAVDDGTATPTATAATAAPIAVVPAAVETVEITALPDAEDTWVMPASCHAKCRWQWPGGPGSDGPRGVAFVGAPLNQYVCPTMFRDMADWVLKFPFAHFKEKLTMHGIKEIAECLRPGAIIYAQTGEVLRDFAVGVVPQLKRPYILVTGQSDFGATQWGRQILNDPHLIKWYAQNPDTSHAKLEAIPIGLNCFEHAPEIQKFRDSPAFRQNALLPPPHTSVANFNGKTHQDRGRLLDRICPSCSAVMKELPANGSAHRQFACKEDWVHCHQKTVQNAIQGNPHLVAHYTTLSGFKYWLSPRGNGLDCHRTWEAMYVHRVPVVVKSLLDPLWPVSDRDLPILVVDSIGDITEQKLAEEWTARFQDGMAYDADPHAQPQTAVEYLRAVERQKASSSGGGGSQSDKQQQYTRHKLWRPYWRYRIERARRKHFGWSTAPGVMVTALEREGRQCWGRT
jgi:hypothetical protein